MTCRPVTGILKIFIAVILHIFLFCAVFPSILLSAETCPQEALSQCAAPLSSNASNFNGTSMAGDRYIWFNSIVKVNGRGGNPAAIRFAGSKISFSVNGEIYELAVPDAEIIFSPVAMAQTDFTGCKWVTTVPLGYTGNVFLSGLAFQIPEGGLPGGINPVTWSGHFMTQTSGIDVQWKWAAAVYTQFSGDYSGVGVKPIDGDKFNQYNNSDHAGTPEGFKSYVTGGARGGGGSNYTGSYSGTLSNDPTLDTTPPNLSVSTLSDGSWTRNGSLNVSGQVTDNTCIQRLTVNGIAVTTVPDGNFSYTATLQEGPNTISVTASDLAGNQVSDTRTINLDSSAPLVTITSPATGSFTNKNTTSVTGTISDETAAQVTVNGLEAAVSQGTFVIESVPLTEGANTITAIATDSAGNTGSDSVMVISDTIAPVVTINTPADGLLTNVVTHTVSGSVTDASPIESAMLNTIRLAFDSSAFSQQYSLAEGMNTLTVAATDKAGNNSSAAITVTLDTIPPATPLIDMLPDMTNAMNITVTGSAEAGSLVKIAGAGEVAADASGRFSITVSLAPDAVNTFSATATDGAGNVSAPSVFSILQDFVAPEVTGFSIMADPKVTLNIPVSIIFTEEIDPATINSASIILQGPSGDVSGSFNVSGTEVIFTPDNELAANETYTLTVNTGVKDKAGNNLAAVFTGTFDTLRGPTFILGEVYDDTLGLPLEGAEVRVLLINNEVPAPFSILTDAMGRFSIKYEGAAGEALIEIHKAGYTKALRRASLQPNRSHTVFDLRLTPLQGGITVSASAGGSLASGDTVLNIPTGALIQDTDISLAALSQQSMGYRLPIGWSPLFGVEASPWGMQLNIPGALSIKNIWTQGVVAAFFDEVTMAWVSAAASISGDNIIVEVERLGQYFLLIPDTLPSEPIMPSAAGEPIQPSMDALPDGVTATVELVPPAVLSEEGAHGMTTVIVTSQSPLPSGTTIEARIAEKYNLTGGEVITPEPFTEDITLYNWPDDGDSNTISAQFPATPSRIYPLGKLYYGKVDIDISMPLSGGEEGGDITGGGGGTITDVGGIGIIVPPSSLTDDTVFTLNPLSEQELPVSSPDGLAFLGAMTLQMQGGSFIAGAFPEFIIPGALTEGMEVIITRVGTINGESVLTAVAAGRVSSGKITITRCLTAGCITPGQYAFYNPARLVGFITGQVNKDGALVYGAVVTVDNLPFKSETDSNGNFTVLTLSGSYTITAKEPDTGLTALAAGTITGGESAFIQLTLASTRPVVTAITPLDKATAVALTTGIEVTFSEPLNPATVNSASFQMIKDAPGIDVNPIQVKGYISLKSGNTIAVFAPESALESDTIYRVKLTESILDNFSESLIPFESVFSTAEVLGNEALDPWELTASMPDENGYITIRGGPGLAAPDTSVVLFNRTKSITVTITAEPDGSFSGTIRADLGDKIEVHVKDLLDNTTILDPGIFQNPDGTAAVGPDGGTIHGPGGITAFIPEDSFDQFTSVQVTMLPDDAVQDVQINSELKTAGVFKVDMGDVTSNKELKISISAPDWITPEHQILLAKVINIRGVDELTLSCPAILKDGQIISTSPPFDGVTNSGYYTFVSWIDQTKGTAFVLVDVWRTLSLDISYIIGDYFIFDVPYQKKQTIAVTIPVDKIYQLSFGDSGGPTSNRVDIQGPPARELFAEGHPLLKDDIIAPTVFINSIDDGATGVLPTDNFISIEMSEEIDPATVDQAKHPDAVVVTDSNGNRVEGDFYLAADRKTIIFVPRYGYKYNESYTITLNGITDNGGNAVTYSSSFTTFRPEVIATVDVPTAMAIDKFGNYVAVKGDDGKIGLTRASFIEIFDVSDPLNPQTVGRQDLWGYYKDVKFVSDTAQIVAVGGRSDREGFLDLIDVSDPVNSQYSDGIYLSWSPSYSSSPPEGVPFGGGSPEEVAVIGTNAYVANHGVGLQGVDLSQVTPSNDTAQQDAISVSLADRSFSAVSTLGDKILAIKNGSLLILSQGLATLGELSGLNFPYSVTGVESFPIDVDNDGNLGTFEDSDGDSKKAIDETFNLALVTTSDGIVVIDVSTPSAPMKIDFIPAHVWKVEVNRERRMAFGLSGGGLTAISLKCLSPMQCPLPSPLTEANDPRLLYTLTDASGMDFVLGDDGGKLTAYVADYSWSKLKIVALNQPEWKVTLLDAAGTQLFDSRTIQITNDSSGKPVMPDVKARIMPVDPKDQHQVLYATDIELNSSEVCWNVKVEYKVTLTGDNTHRSRKGLLTNDGFIFKNTIINSPLCPDGIVTIGPELNINKDGPLTWDNKFGGGALNITAKIINKDMPKVGPYDGTIEGERTTDAFRTQMIAYLKQAATTARPVSIESELGSADVLFALACVENDGINHFYPPAVMNAKVPDGSKYGFPKGSNYPIENTTGDGGFGVMQLTKWSTIIFDPKTNTTYLSPPYIYPTYEQIWHWQKNIDKAVDVIWEKIGMTESKFSNLSPYQKRMNVYSLFRGKHYWTATKNGLDVNIYNDAGVHEATKAYANEGQPKCQ